MHVTHSGIMISLTYLSFKPDMRNRYEQTVLMLSAMKHFGYQNCDMEVRNGTHCHYVKLKDEAGVSVFGQMFYDFYNKVMG